VKEVLKSVNIWRSCSQESLFSRTLCAPGQSPA